MNVFFSVIIMIQEHLKSNLTKNSVLSDNTTIHLQPEAYFKIIYHSLTYANRNRDKKDWLEVMGWLSGKVTIEPNTNDQIILVSRSWPISHGDTVSVSIENYGSTLNKVLLKVSQRNEVILGWYHSHPSYGLFMSQTDFETQLSYQKLYEHSFALVFDHTIWSTINSGLEGYRLLKNFKTFDIIPIKILNYSQQLNLKLYDLFMKKIANNVTIEELDVS